MKFPCDRFLHVSCAYPYLEPAFAELNRDGIPTPLDIIKHITPLGWQHISLTGDYIWTPTDGVDLRPLRRETSILAA